MEGVQKIELLENLSEGSRLLDSVHREESLARKSLVLANLNASLKTTLSNTTVDEWLFGGDFEDRIKSTKSLKRTSKDFKLSNKPSQQKIVKNWRDPAHQSSYKRRLTTSGGNRRQTSNTSDSKRQFDRREDHRYKRRSSINVGKPAGRLRLFDSAWAKVTHDSESSHPKMDQRIRNFFYKEAMAERIFGRDYVVWL